MMLARMMFHDISLRELPILNWLAFPFYIATPLGSIIEIYIAVSGPAHLLVKRDDLFWHPR